MNDLGELLNLQRGQGLDLVWRDSLRCPTEEEYISMVNNSAYTTHGGVLRLWYSCLPLNDCRDWRSVPDRRQAAYGLRVNKYGCVSLIPSDRCAYPDKPTAEITSP